MRMPTQVGVPEREVACTTQTGTKACVENRAYFSPTATSACKATRPESNVTRHRS
jgi:hypothetical protein